MYHVPQPTFLRFFLLLIPSVVAVSNRPSVTMKETPLILWFRSKLCTPAGLNCCLLLSLAVLLLLSLVVRRLFLARADFLCGSAVERVYPYPLNKSFGLGYNNDMALACSGRATVSRAAASLLGTRASSATACSVAPRLRSGRNTSSPGVTPLTRKGSDAGTTANAWASNVATCNVSRRHLSSGGGDVDYSSLMAGPGTALHDDIMESAARKQTG